MRLTVLGSSSEGNCYLLTTEDGKETLIIEAGVPYRSVARALGGAAAGIRGCLISHSHKDHCGRLGEFTRLGIETYMTAETKAAAQAAGAREIRPTEMFGTGSFSVVPFPVTHDVPCVGFLISHPEMGTLAFITDTQYSTYRFDGIDYMMVEANYDEEIALSNIRAAMEYGEQQRAMALRTRLKRLKSTHMEINTTLELLKANARTNRLAKVILIHTSKENGDPSDFCRRAEKAAGCPVLHATPLLTVELNKPKTTRK